MVEPRVVFAAGGVVWRPATAASGPPRLAEPAVALPEIVLVHRARYDDWTLPKGKLDKGEHPLSAAVREVAEETGVHAVPQLRLPRVRYLTGEPGVEKVVDYWSMRVASQRDRAPDDEVDEVRWVPAAAAPALLTYGHDRGVLKAFLEYPLITAVVALVRHACAGERARWNGPDVDRPLDAEGQRQAPELSAILAHLGPARIVSASPVRCRDTVRPLADRLSLDLAVDPRFDESADPEVAASALRTLAGSPQPVVVCSQGKLIPPLLELLTGRAHQHFRTAKATGWVLCFADQHLAAVDYLDPNRDAVQAGR